MRCDGHDGLLLVRWHCRHRHRDWHHYACYWHHHWRWRRRYRRRLLFGRCDLLGLHRPDNVQQHVDHGLLLDRGRRLHQWRYWRPNRSRLVLYWPQRGLHELPHRGKVPHDGSITGARGLPMDVRPPRYWRVCRLYWRVYWSRWRHRQLQLPECRGYMPPGSRSMGLDVRAHHCLRWSVLLRPGDCFRHNPEQVRAALSDCSTVCAEVQISVLRSRPNSCSSEGLPQKVVAVEKSESVE